MLDFFSRPILLVRVNLNVYGDQCDRNGYFFFIPSDILQKTEHKGQKHNIMYDFGD